MFYKKGVVLKFSYIHKTSLNNVTLQRNSMFNINANRL